MELSRKVKLATAGAVVSVGLAMAGVAVEAQRAPKPPAQPQHQEHAGHDAATPAKMSDRCKMMMQMHHQMHADTKKMDDRLSQLTQRMNQATGDERVAAIAAVVSALVEQRQAMQAKQGQMHGRMMAHMAEHMAVGKESMARCPMMQHMAGGHEGGQPGGGADHQEHRR